MDETIRVVLAEDHPVVRRGMRSILEGQADLQLVGEVDHGRDVEPAIEELRPDVLLLDLKMPELDPAPLTRRLKERYPQLQVLVLTAHDDPAYVVGLLAAGAAGYALKDEASDTLVTAIRAVAQGQSWFSHRVTQQLAHKLQEPQSASSGAGRDDLKSLTPREMEILALIGEEADNSEIARRLHISKRTVETHVNRINAKLGFRRRSQAILYAAECGLAAGPRVSDPEGID